MDSDHAVPIVVQADSRQRQVDMPEDARPVVRVQKHSRVQACRHWPSVL
jgi:hypothetical protein